MKQNREHYKSQLLSCSEVERQLDSYLDHCLKPAELLSFKGHLENCSSCSTLVNEFVFLRETARSLGDRGIPTGVQERLRNRLSQETSYRSPKNVTRLQLIK